MTILADAMVHNITHQHRTAFRPTQTHTQIVWDTVDDTETNRDRDTDRNTEEDRDLTGTQTDKGSHETVGWPCWHDRTGIH